MGTGNVAATNIVDSSDTGETRILGSGKDSKTKTAAPPQKPAEKSVAPELGKTQGLHGESKTVKTDARSEGTTTRYGSVMGTLAYMPPEQAQGKLDEMDARTDIYSLGAILYEILVNDAPIPRGKMQEMLDYVIKTPIIPPRDIDPTVPKPLNAIAMKALNKKISDRYRSALDLARDVEEYLADEPISVYEEPWYLKLKRWARRHPKAVTGWTATVGVMILGSVAWSWAESNRIEGLRIAAISKGKNAQAEAVAGRFEEATSLLNEALGEVGDEDELASVEAGLNNQLSGVEQLIAAAEQRRISTLQREVEQKVEVEARQLALAQFTKFEALVEQARYYFIVQTGDDATQNLTTAAEHAVSAFGIYGGMSPTYLQIPPPYLSEKQYDEIRNSSYELLIMLAEREEAIALGLSRNRVRRHQSNRRCTQRSRKSTGT